MGWQVSYGIRLALSVLGLQAHATVPGPYVGSGNSNLVLRLAQPVLLTHWAISPALRKGYTLFSPTAVIVLTTRADLRLRSASRSQIGGQPSAQAGSFQNYMAAAFDYWLCHVLGNSH